MSSYLGDNVRRILLSWNANVLDDNFLNRNNCPFMLTVKTMQSLAHGSAPELW